MPQGVSEGSTDSLTTGCLLRLLYFMPTLFKRVEVFRAAKKKPALTNEQMVELGKQVIEHYVTVKPTEAVINYAYSEENGQTFKVIDYPKKFNPEIDRMIADYYKAIEPKLRKRIPYKKPLNK